MNFDSWFFEKFGTKANISHNFAEGIKYSKLKKYAKK
jgi:hypothetical protein